MKNFIGKCSLAVTGLFVSSLAFALAVPLDTSETVLQIAEINTGVAAVGGALVAAAAIAVGFKWLKGAIFS